jgi:CopG family nickel-responsive transcriptional regulator
MVAKKEYAARTSFSLPPKLLKELDEVTEVMGYSERSRALQTAIRNLVDESRITKDASALATGAVVVLYDHTKRGIDGMITNTGDHFGRLIVSTLHIHLDDPDCLNIIAVKGSMGKITELGQHLRKLPGVTQVKVTCVLTEDGKQSR